MCGVNIDISLVEQAARWSACPVWCTMH